jgi:methyl-accepting chemotaxis protein
MKKLAYVVCFCGVLVGCSPNGTKISADTIKDIARQGSGAVQTVKDTVELGKLGVKQLGQKVDDIRRRADQVKAGMDKISQAEQLIKGAVTAPPAVPPVSK